MQQPAAETKSNKKEQIGISTKNPGAADQAMRTYFPVVAVELSVILREPEPEKLSGVSGIIQVGETETAARAELIGRDNGPVRDG